MSSNLITLVVPAGLPQLWKDGHKAFVLKVVSRTLQCLLAIIIVIIYAVDLANFSSAHARAPAAWVYAEVVGTLSLLTCALHYFYTLERAWWATLDFVLCVLWSAQAGYFGTIYLSGNSHDDGTDGLSNSSNMKAGAGVGLACVVLWLLTCVQSLVRRCRAHRKRRADRKRVDRTIETVEAHNDTGRLVLSMPGSALLARENPREIDGLPSYGEATTKEALTKQREALGIYDNESDASQAA